MAELTIAIGLIAFDVLIVNGLWQLQLWLRRHKEARMNQADLIAAGDLLQSAASRLAEWVLTQPDVPYEVRMAAHEAGFGIDGWTRARLASNIDGSARP